MGKSLVTPWPWVQLITYLPGVLWFTLFAYVWCFQEAWYIPSKVLITVHFISMGVAFMFMDDVLEPIRYFGIVTTWSSFAHLQLFSAFTFICKLSVYFWLRRRAMVSAKRQISQD